MTNSFDSRPDAALGRLLRDTLEPAHHAAFVGRIGARIRAEARETAWDILAGWARPGMAAAAAAALALALWLTQSAGRQAEIVTIADAVESSVPAQLLAGGADAGTEAVLAAMVGDR